MAPYRQVSRREFLTDAGKVVLAASAGPAFLAACAEEEKRPPRKLAGELKILQWSHFVPRYDKWFDPFAKAWGTSVGVLVTVDHIDLAGLPARTSAEIAAGEGHDLIELLSPPAAFEKSALDLADVNKEAERRFGTQVALCRKSTFNPTTDKFYGFCHGWTPDPGDYRKSLWEKVGLPNGPTTWDELLEGGRRIKKEQGVQMGIGMSNEIDSNMAARALVWSFGGSVQDKNEKVVINSPETVKAVEHMARLFRDTMTDEVFGWTAASNNQGLIAGKLSWILNSISAYRTAQTARPDVANDVFFTPALKGPGGQFASEHVIPIYIIPRHAKPRCGEGVPPEPRRELRRRRLQLGALQLPRVPEDGAEALRERRMAGQRPVQVGPARQAQVPEGRRDVEHQRRPPGPGERGNRRGVRHLHTPADDGEGRPRRALRQGSG